MTIASIIISIVLFLMFLVVPIFELVGFVDGLDFLLYNEPTIVIIQASVALVAMIVLLIMHHEFGITEKIFWNFIPPLAIGNAICFAEAQWNISVVFAIVWSLCCFIVYLKFIPDGFFKAMSAVFSVLLTTAFVVMYLVFGVFMPITDKATVTETFTSPDGTYIAEEKAVDGTFSDKMRVDVKMANPVSDVWLGCYVYDSIEIYEGESYETETAKISWKDNSTLVINGNEYKISFGENSN